MLKAKGVQLLLVGEDVFTGWIEAFQCRTEKVKEIVRTLVDEIIPQFGLPKSLQNDNWPAFKATVSALGIQYHLQCSWRPQSSEKVERANEILKQQLRKLSQKSVSFVSPSFPLHSCKSEILLSEQALVPLSCCVVSLS